MQASILRSSLLIGLGLIAAALPATAVPAFTIAASNVTMPASGNGSSQYTVSQIPLTGFMNVNCAYSGPTTDAKIPTCSYGPIHVQSVTAGQTVTGTMLFYPYGVAVPLSTPHSRHAPAGLALAGGLLLGFGLWRRPRRWLQLAVLSVAALAALASLSACTGSFNNMTPGTYQYTLTAEDGATVNNLVAGATTTIDVTVP
jgi:hypothetical protein